MTFPRSISADDRETVRQIAQHFDFTYKVLTEGNEKEIRVFKPDFSRFEQVEAAQDLKSKEIDSLKDALLNSHFCLGLTQATLNRDQHKLKLLAKEVELLKRLVKDPLNKDVGRKLEHFHADHQTSSDACSRCDKHNVSHAVFPCGHIFCKSCADEARSSRECYACAGTVEGVLEIENPVAEPEPKRVKD